MHACVSCEGFPLTIQINSGEGYDIQHFIEVIENIQSCQRFPRKVWKVGEK
ncbi:hypothetical protein [Methanomethylovorans sp.]|uniref:hypothetical protein n=1 Tax=Methanomethylovorans sp. TaxID=2758717 RepID=UPI00351C2B7C